MYVKVRGKDSSVFSGFICDRGFLIEQSEQIGETLIARHLTYPFPQLDVQPCAADRKVPHRRAQIRHAIG